MTSVNEFERSQIHQLQIGRGTSLRREEPIFPDQRGQSNFHLNHAVFDANAVPMSRAERYVSVGMSTAARLGQEIVRVEFLGIGVKQRTRLQEQRTNDQRRPLNRDVRWLKK